MQRMMDQAAALLDRHGVSCYGSGGVAALAGAPPDFRPEDLLPGAAGLLCFGLPVPTGVLRAPGRALTMYWRTAAVYYRFLDVVATQVAALFEAHGHRAAPVYG